MAIITDDSLLPQRHSNKVLAQESVDKLGRIFPTEDYVIREEHKEDAGIDLSIELAKGGRYSNRKINVQLKSKHKSKFNNDGTLSKQIDRMNLLYLKRSTLLGLYFLYVKENDTYYYEWAHEFEDTLSRTTPDWLSQEKITLHFVKVLDAAAAQEIFERVEMHAAVLEQFRTGLKIEDVINSFHKSSDEKYYDSIEWSLLNLIATFDGLTVFPNHLLVKLPPFSRSASSRSYFNEYDNTLYTDNKVLHEFFITLFEENGIIRRKIDGKVEEVDQEVMKEMLTFLEYDSIHHIGIISHKGDDRICVHNLFAHSEKCECEKCSYSRLNWGMVIEKLNVDLDNTQTYHWLRRGYVLLELGKVKEAFNTFKELSEISRAKRKYFASFIAKFSLVSMLFIVRRQYLKDEGENMEKEILQIDLRNEIFSMLLFSQVKREVVLVLLWLIESEYYHQLYVEIDMEYQKILAARYADQRGGVVNSYHYRTIARHVSEITMFSEGNAFHPQYFNGFRVICHKMVEAALVLYGLQNPLSRRLDAFDNYILHLCLMYGDPEQLNKLFIRYNVHPIKLQPRHDEGPKTIFSKIDSLMESLEKSVKFSNEEKEVGNLVPGERLNRQLYTSGVLLSIMDESVETINRNVLNFIRSAVQYQQVESGIFNGLLKIFARKGSVILLNSYLELYKWLINSNRYDNHSIIVEIPYLIVEYFPEYRCTDDLIESSIRERFSKIKNRHRDNFDVILGYWQIASDSFKTEIQQFAADQLKASFDSRLFYLSSIHGVIAYGDYLEEYFSRIPQSANAKEASRSLMGYDDYTNDNLDQFLHLAFEFNFDLTSDKVQKLHGGVPYYEWLLDMEKFDYSKFNPYWILHRPIESFISEYKKYPAIKAAIETALKKNPNQRLTEIYFNNFC